MKVSTDVIFRRLFVRYTELSEIQSDIRAAVEALTTAYRHGGKLLVCGNGGSAADSEHIVGELMKGFLLPRRVTGEIAEKLLATYPEEAGQMLGSLQQAAPAISLVSQTALMTAFGNDLSSEMIFAQQVLGYGQPGDVLLAISTSGNSANVLHAARVAHVKGVKVISLTGKTGGKLKALSDICLCAPTDITFEIQEYHLPIYHCLCACVENELFGDAQ